ncbi:transposase [Pseudomonas sp. 21LCFQ010]|nr:transposase [Pseudomonas sp. 21LCFQ010]MCO8166082.1 transposase [Pseudomonas sp. 21LCFQ010]
MPAHAHARNLRIGRRSIQGQIYLVTCAVRERAPVFAQFHIGRMLVAQLRCLHEAGAVNSLAWVVMPDHLHWLFELRSGSLSQLMQQLKGANAYAINRACGNQTLRWQKGYHDHAARTQEQVLEMARYVIANPVRAGLVESEGDYPLWDCVWT